jgi:hypothetical protein
VKLPLHQNIETCHRCLHARGKLLDCRGTCLCPESQKPFIEHAQSDSCPIGNFFAKVAPDSPVQRVLELIEGPARPMPPGWLEWKNVRDAYAIAAKRVLSSLPPADSSFAGVGRGAVIIGGGKYFASAWITCQILLHLGFMGQIEFWSLPGELLEWQRTLLEKLGVIPREPDPRRMRVAGGWQLKAWALEHCSFRQVLMLDADSYPIREPSFLFQLEQFKQTGAIFWPDQPSFDLRRETWDVLGLDWRDEPDVESGQMVIDRAKVWPAIVLANWLNQHSDYFYHVLPGPGGIHGDKTLFHLAFRLAGIDYAMPQKRWSFAAPALVQKDFDGYPLFIHRTNGKFALEEDASGYKVFTTTPQPENLCNPDLPLEEFAWEQLRKLRKLAIEQGSTPPPPRKPDIQLAGDVVEKIAKQIGAEHLAKLWEKWTGIPCGCNDRKEKLNRGHQMLMKYYDRIVGRAPAPA